MDVLRTRGVHCGRVEFKAPMGHPSGSDKLAGVFRSDTRAWAEWSLTWCDDIGRLGLQNPILDWGDLLALKVA